MLLSSITISTIVVVPNGAQNYIMYYDESMVMLACFLAWKFKAALSWSRRFLQRDRWLERSSRAT